MNNWLVNDANFAVKRFKTQVQVLCQIVSLFEFGHKLTQQKIDLLTQNQKNMFGFFLMSPFSRY